MKPNKKISFMLVATIILSFCFSSLAVCGDSGLISLPTITDPPTPWDIPVPSPVSTPQPTITPSEPPMPYISIPTATTIPNSTPIPTLNTQLLGTPSLDIGADYVNISWKLNQYQQYNTVFIRKTTQSSTNTPYDTRGDSNNYYTRKIADLEPNTEYIITILGYGGQPILYTTSFKTFAKSANSATNNNISSSNIATTQKSYEIKDTIKLTGKIVSENEAITTVSINKDGGYQVWRNEKLSTYSFNMDSVILDAKDFKYGENTLTVYAKTQSMTNGIEICKISFYISEQTQEVKPVVKFNGLKENQEIKGNITLNVSTNVDSKIDQVVYYVDNVYLANGNKNNQWATSLNTMTLKNGSHKIAVNGIRYRDKNSKEYDLIFSESISLIVNNSAISDIESKYGNDKIKLVQAYLNHMGFEDIKVDGIQGIITSYQLILYQYYSSITRSTKITGVVSDSLIENLKTDISKGITKQDIDNILKSWKPAEPSITMDYSINGKINTDKLVSIPMSTLSDTAYLETKTSVAWAMLVKGAVEANKSLTEFQKLDINKFTALGANSGYRKYGPKDVYGTQEYFYDLYTKEQGNLAAKPGTSNHGWGLAIDFNISDNGSAGGGKGFSTTKEVQWLEKNASTYGFKGLVSNYQDNKPYYSEIWHWDYK